MLLFILEGFPLLLSESTFSENYIEAISLPFGNHPSYNLKTEEGNLVIFSNEGIINTRKLEEFQIYEVPMDLEYESFQNIIQTMLGDLDAYSRLH